MKAVHPFINVVLLVVGYLVLVAAAFIVDTAMRVLK